MKENIKSIHLNFLGFPSPSTILSGYTEFPNYHFFRLNKLKKK
jgi:hypothetical protein